MAQMENYVRRYLREEVSDRNAVGRALTRNHGKIYSFLPADEGVGRADLWPELTDGKLENATNFNFMATLRGTSSIPADAATAAHRRASSAGGLKRGQQHRGALFESCSRPQWNRDTRHLDHGEDPLQKCLRESLRSKGYHRDYDAAKRDADSLKHAEVERLRRKMQEQEYVARQLEQQRVLSQQWQEVLVLEKTKRDTLLRGERTIRLKFESEFRKTVSLVVELTEFNQRKRLFKLAMQQLDELKVLEREEFLEHQMYQKMHKQRELEEIRRQQTLETQRRRADEHMKRVHALATEEITARDRIVRWAVQKLVEFSQFELEGRDALLRREIMDSIVYEEALQRQLVADTGDRYFRAVIESADSARLEVEERAQKARNAQFQRLQQEEIQRARQRFDRQAVELMQSEVLERSDVSTGAQKSMSSLTMVFLRSLQILRFTEQEVKARLLVSDDELKGRQVLQRSCNDLSHRALDAIARHARQLEEQRLQQEEQRRYQEEQGRKALLEGEIEQKRIQGLREKVERQNKPFLGVTLAERTEPELALLVESLYVEGPCDAAGIKIGDVFVTVGGVQVSSFSTMRDAINQHARMGERLSVVVLRDQKTVETSIQVLTADKEFAELKDIYFDTERHVRHKRDDSSPIKPDKSSQGSTPTASPGKPPLSRLSPRR
jgi:hypothetical protein